MYVSSEFVSSNRWVLTLFVLHTHNARHPSCPSS
jgi:hypothetical protein